MLFPGEHGLLVSIEKLCCKSYSEISSLLDCTGIYLVRVNYITAFSFISANVSTENMYLTVDFFKRKVLQKYFAINKVY